MSIAFLFWLCIAAVNDAIQRKCFNWVALVGLGLGLISILFNPQGHPVEITVFDSLAGVFVGFFVFLVFYQLKMMGAGDVKFAAALGAWVGWQLLLPIWALSCVFSIVHGIIATQIGNFRMSVSEGISVSQIEKKKKFIPYVTYLALATVLILILGK